MVDKETLWYLYKYDKAERLLAQNARPENVYMHVHYKYFPSQIL